jgi:hypothetical protein
MEAESIVHTQGSYDKIIKENMKEILPVLMDKVLEIGEDCLHEEVPVDVQHTIERRPDLVQKITDRNGNSYLLHLEWQTNNEKSMVYRMAEYSVLLQRKFKLPIEQYVVYMGRSRPRMRNKINIKNFRFRFGLKSLKEFDYKIFLHAKDPKAKVAAILCNFDSDGEEKAVENIFHELKASEFDSLEAQKRFNQLRGLLPLCKESVNQKFKSMLDFESFYSIEKDILYEMGMERERKKNLLYVEDALKEVGLHPSYVKRIMRTMRKRLK